MGGHRGELISKLESMRYHVARRVVLDEADVPARGGVSGHPLTLEAGSNMYPGLAA